MILELSGNQEVRKGTKEIARTISPISTGNERAKRRVKGSDDEDVKEFDQRQTDCWKF